MNTTARHHHSPFGLGRLRRRSLIGVLLVAVGVMFLLDTVDATGEGTTVFATYWPSLLIIWGAWGLMARGFQDLFFSVGIFTIGILFLLNELGVLSWDIGRLWPIILIILGLAVLTGWGGRTMLMGRRRRQG